MLFLYEKENLHDCHLKNKEIYFAPFPIYIIFAPISVTNE